MSGNKNSNIDDTHKELKHANIDIIKTEKRWTIGIDREGNKENGSNPICRLCEQKTESIGHFVAQF